MSRKAKILKRILCCVLAAATLVTTTSVSELISNAIYVNNFSTYQAYPGHGGDSIQTIANTKASSGKYGWQNTLSLLGSVGTLKNDGTGYSSLTVPTSTNKTASGVNANGETASDRIANAWSNGYSFYMSPPSDSDDYEYIVTRNGVDYVFNKDNNWGWDYLESGKAFNSSNSIFKAANTYSTTEILAGDSIINKNRTAVGIAPYSTANHRWLTYDELFSKDSGLVQRPDGIMYENDDIWAESSGNPSSLMAKEASMALGLKYITSGYSTSIDKSYENPGGGSEWRTANMYLAWMYKYYSNVLATKTLEEIANDEQYYSTDNYETTYGEEELTLGKVALETIKNMKHSGWGFALQESDKGTLSCTYKNVGKWYDPSTNTWHNVDVKLTVMDYQGNDIFNYRQARYSANGTAANSDGSFMYTNLAAADFFDSNYTRTYGGALLVGNEYTAEHPKFSFTADKIGIDTMESCYVKCNYSFTDSDTGKSLEVCGNSTWKDIDGAQSVSFKMAGTGSNSTGVTGIYDYGKKLRINNAIAGYTGSSSLNSGNYDTILYKNWAYQSSKGIERYLGAFDWLSSTSSDHFISNWVYAEFRGPFDVVYGIMGHNNINRTGAASSYNPYNGNLTVSGSNLAANNTENQYNYYDKSKNEHGTITVPAVHAISNAGAHIASDAPEGEIRGNLSITKKIQDSDGKITAPSSTDISSIYFVIRDTAGNYVTYDPSSSSAGEYTAVDTVVSNYKAKSTAKFRLASDGSLNIYGLQAGAYFIEEKTSDITARNEYSTTTIISSDGKTIYYDTTPIIVQENTTESVVVTNYKEKGNLRFTKFIGALGVISSNKALLNGLEFKIAVDTSETERLSEYSNNDYYVVATQNGSGDYSYSKLGSPVGVTAVNQSTVFKLASDSSLSLSNLPVGTYYITEVTGNSLFKDLMSDIKFTVQSEKTANVYGINETKKGTVIINKTNNDGSTVSDGIKFTLSGTSSYGTTVSVIGMTKNGKVTFSNVPIGTYTLSEDASTVPEGYSAADDKTVTVSSDGQTVNLNVINTALTGKITYYKYVEQTAGGNDYTLANSSLDNGIWQNSSTAYFYIRNNAGKYITATGNASTGYTYSGVTASYSSATKFTLNGNGQFTVDGLALNDTYAVSEALGSTVSSTYDTPYSTTPTTFNRHDPLGATYYSPAANANSVVLIYNPMRVAGTLNFTKYVQIGDESIVIDNEDIINDLEFMVYGVNPSNGATHYITANGADGEYTFTGYSAPVSMGMYGTTFKLSKAGTIKITGLDPTEYTIIETKGNEEYFIDTMEEQTGTVTSDKSLDLAGYNVLKTGSITVNKMFEGSVVDDYAAFILTGTSDYGTDVALGPVAVSASNNTATFSNIPFGTYTLSETLTPDNYDTAKDLTVMVNDTNKTVSVDIENTATRGSLTIEKYNEDCTDPVDGIQFLIKNVSTLTGTTVEDKIVSITDGFVDIDLPYGTYTVEEIESSMPKGYMPNTKKQTITINSDRSSTSVAFYNAPTMSIVIHKTNDDGTSPKDGIKFEIQCVRPFYTDAPDDITVSLKNGKAQVNDLPSGWYIVTELSDSIPDGYVKESQTVVLTDIEGVAGEVVTAEFENMAIGSLIINKSNDDGSSADGITFSLKGKANNGIAISKSVMIVNGQASIEDIPLGTYTLSENATMVPDGYKVASDRKIEITKAGESVSVDIVNESIKGPITITKRLVEPYYTDEDFIFEISQTDESTDESYSFFVYIVVPAGATEASVTIDNCYSGKRYTVREIQNNWRYTPVTDKTYLTINGDTFDNVSSQTQVYVRYGKSNSDNSMTFKLLNPKVNDFNCIFTNDGHDYWLEDGDTVTNVMKDIE